jgi:glycine dehydrogenase subunit 2|tara:strand:+ start:8511 stop:9974 length:1464 start_codon:yes stop_codon:yes gene_type:complete
MLIFEKGRSGRSAKAQYPDRDHALDDIPANHIRQRAPLLPGVSELQVVRHFTNLSRKNFSIDNQPYPLGSCTMKYNPRGAHRAVNQPGFTNRHPLAPEHCSQGLLACLWDLQECLKDVTGMPSVSLTPMAGAQGEFAGIAMIRAYHASQGEHDRVEIVIPTAAHGTNPATAVMCGYKVREVQVGLDGDMDLDDLKRVIGPQTAGLMMTNPSTCGVFERQISEIAQVVHEAGGLLYYDGANLNAVVGKVKPGDMGFDVLHMNLHKTFATPHGGGGPGAGPVAASEKLASYLPIPVVGRQESDVGAYRWMDESDLPNTIGRLSAFMGNAAVMLRAYAYARLLGSKGLHRVSEFATLNANYMAKQLAESGFDLAYPDRRASHEFVITLSKQSQELGVTAMDFAKRLLDYGYHAPTTYFPLLVPECLLIEPTETECKEDLDGFISAMVAIQKEAQSSPEIVTTAPLGMPVRRLDDVRAAREPDLVWQPADE